MIVRIVNGVPVEEDMVLALENFADTKFVKSRMELFLHKCPMCESEDHRGDGVQGAIAYSLRLHCTTCAKCGKSVGWKETLRLLGVEYSTSLTGPSSIEALSRSVKATAERAQVEEAAYADHGDRGKPVDIAWGEHLVRFLAPGGRVKSWLEARGFRFDELYGIDPRLAWAGECAAGWLVLAYRNADGSVRGFKYRNIDTKDFSAQKGAQDEPYGIEDLDPNNASLTWVEGELDARILKQFGFVNVLSVPNGANSWRTEWCLYAQHAAAVFVGSDNDSHGEALASKMFAEIPKEVPTITRMARLLFREKGGGRVKDANDAVIGGADVEMLKQAYREAEDPDLTSIEMAKQNESGRIIPTRYKSVNEVLGGGCLTGEVIHLAGPAKSGKTTIVIDLHRGFASSGVKSGFVPLDMGTSKIVTRVGMSLMNKTDADFYATEVGSADRAGLIVTMSQQMSAYFKGLFVISKENRISTYGGAMAAIERMGRSGCRVVTVEDYLSLASMYEMENHGRGTFSGRNIIRDLTEIADRCNCHVILINHLKNDESAYGSGQLGAGAQANIQIHANLDAMGNKKSITMHVIDSRLSGTMDVDIDLVMSGSDKSLVASPRRAHRKVSGRKLKSGEDGGRDRDHGF